MTTALDQLRSLGAELVDDIELEIRLTLGGAELTVFLAEMKSAMAAYLERRGDPKVRSQFDVMLFDLQNRERELRIVGHEWFAKAQVIMGLQTPGYREARAMCLAIARDRLLDGSLQKHRLDAIVVGTGGPPWLIDPVAGDTFTAGPNSASLPAIAGYPHVTVPAGWYYGLPVGLSFIGGEFSEVGCSAMPSRTNRRPVTTSRRAISRPCRSDRSAEMIVLHALSGARGLSALSSSSCSRSSRLT